MTLSDINHFHLFSGAGVGAVLKPAIQARVKNQHGAQEAADGLGGERVNASLLQVIEDATEILQRDSHCLLWINDHPGPRVNHLLDRVLQKRIELGGKHSGFESNLDSLPASEFMYGNSIESADRHLEVVANVRLPRICEAGEMVGIRGKLRRLIFKSSDSDFRHAYQMNDDSGVPVKSCIVPIAFQVSGCSFGGSSLVAAYFKGAINSSDRSYRLNPGSPRLATSIGPWPRRPPMDGKRSTYDDAADRDRFGQPPAAFFHCQPLRILRRESYLKWRLPSVMTRAHVVLGSWKGRQHSLSTTHLWVRPIATVLTVRGEGV